jgi:tRNA(Glu) U13 pseudouridine synthase TruD
MQEEVDEKTVALVINGGKISGRILKAALEKMVRGIEEKRRLTGSETEARKKEKAASKAAQKEVKKANKPGRRTLKSMMESGSELSNIEITDNNSRSFEKPVKQLA